MTHLLPNQEQSHTVSATVGQEKAQNFPSISRFITEWGAPTHILLYAKLFFASFFSGILVVSILFQVFILMRNMETVKSIEVERHNVSQEIQYWKQISQQYQGYRDVYFRIAALEYKRGEIAESKKYMDKALEVDPNFEAGRVLGEKIKQQ